MDKLKKFFQWAFTTIGLVLLIVGGVQLLDLGLKKYIFTKADYNYCYQPVPVEGRPDKPVADNVDYQKQCEDQRSSYKQRQASNATAFLLVGSPIFFGFLRQARRD